MPAVKSTHIFERPAWAHAQTHSAHTHTHLLAADLVTLLHWKWLGNTLTAFIAFLYYSVVGVFSYREQHSGMNDGTEKN